MRSQKFIFGLVSITLFLSSQVFASISSVDDFDVAAPIEAIPTKETGDLIRAAEINSIIDVLRGITHDDGGTTWDSGLSTTDDKLDIQYDLDVDGDLAVTGTICDGTGDCIGASEWDDLVPAGLNYSGAGEVGIGVAIPLGKLHIDKGLSSKPPLVVSKGTYTWDPDGDAYDIVVGDGNDYWGIDAGTNFGIGNSTTPDLFYIDATGNVGIGTTTPEAKLDVDGGIKFGDDTDVCDASKAGTTRYNSVETELELCDGTDWVVVGGGSTSGGGWVHSGQEVFNGGVSTTWTDLDLSSIVGAQRTLVMLHITPLFDNDVPFRIGFKTKGISDALIGYGVTAGFIRYDIDRNTNVIVETSSSGFVQFKAELNMNIKIDTIGYIGSGEGGDIILPVCTDGQVITYNSGTSDWECADGSGGKFVNGTDTNDAVYTTGNVGIGTTTPVSKLEVDGGIKFGDDTDVCDASKAGTTRYNSVETELELCDGTDWVVVGGGSSSGGGSSQIVLESGNNDGTATLEETFTLTQDAVVSLASSARGSNYPLVSLFIDGVSCAIDRSYVVSGNNYVSASCHKDLSAGIHTIKSIYMTDNMVWHRMSWVVIAKEITTSGGSGTSLPTCADGEFLSYNGTSSDWECSANGSGTTLPTCADGQILEYDTTTSAWICTNNTDMKVYRYSNICTEASSYCKVNCIVGVAVGCTAWTTGGSGAATMFDYQGADCTSYVESGGQTVTVKVRCLKDASYGN